MVRALPLDAADTVVVGLYVSRVHAFVCGGVCRSVQHAVQ